MSSEKEKFIPLDKIQETPTKIEIDKMDDFGHRLKEFEEKIKSALPINL